MNLAGLVFLSMRSWELGEAAFVAVNLIGAAFWLLACAVKARELLVGGRRRETRAAAE